MSSRAHSFRGLENRLPGLGAAASLIVCQILSWSPEPASPTFPSFLHAEACYTCRPMSTHTWAHTGTHGGVQAPGQTHICTYIQTCVYTQMYLHTGTYTVCTQIYHCTHANRLHVHICRQIYLLQCMYMPSHRVYTQTYPCIHMCTRVQTCLHTHLHTTAHPHIYRHKTAHVYTDGIWSGTHICI